MRGQCIHASAMAALRLAGMDPKTSPRWQTHVPRPVQTQRAVVKRDMTRLDIAVLQQDHAQN
ncbi:hypothetical protein [Thiomonas delicata]|nr:hypothetical protein [Thiomonas delicata]